MLLPDAHCHGLRERGAWSNAGQADEQEARLQLLRLSTLALPVPLLSILAGSRALSWRLRGLAVSARGRLALCSFVMGCQRPAPGTASKLQCMPGMDTKPVQRSGGDGSALEGMRSVQPTSVASEPVHTKAYQHRRTAKPQRGTGKLVGRRAQDPAATRAQSYVSRACHGICRPPSAR